MRAATLRAVARASTIASLCLPALSCGRDHESATDPSPDQVLPTWAAPVLSEEPSLLVVPTYDETGEVVHPDIVAFPDDWNGFRYWLTMTPYPGGDPAHENPSLLGSRDGRSLLVPPGVHNPIVRPPGMPDFNSDPDLTWDDAHRELVLSYRVVQYNTNAIKIIASADGVVWTAPRRAFAEPSHSAVSQSLVPATAEHPAMMWYVDAGPKGCAATSTRVKVRRALQTDRSLADVEWGDAAATDLRQEGYNIWHMKVRYVPAKREYWALYVAYPRDGKGCGADDLFLAQSKDGVHWHVFPNPVMRHERHEWSAGALYRGSFLYDSTTDRISMWLSARGRDAAWRMVHARFTYARLVNRLSAPSLPADRLPTALSREVWSIAP